MAPIKALVHPTPSGPRDVPRLDVDLYRLASLHNPQPVYQQIRDAGPLVWLPKHQLWAMGRFEDVRQALRDDATFRSGGGVAANPVANLLGRYTTLSSDDDTHLRRRRIMMQSLTSRAITPSAETFEQEAVATVERLLERESFDGVADFAARLPVQAVADLVGVRVPPSQMLTWAGATFNGLGPLNWRSLRSLRSAIGLYLYTVALSRRTVTPGGWAATVFDAADRGEISTIEAKNMIIDFVAPSLDTTILATGQLLWSLGRNPDAFQQLKDDPTLVPTAVVEAVRLASPIRGFTRVVARDTVLHGVPLQAGARVVLLFAAGNTDERQFDRPHDFTLHRRGSNLGWGHGIHTCVGMQLAKLEMQTLLHAMLPRVQTITVWDPQPVTNNCLQGLQSFSARFTGAG
ncbi:cytochrome P450 [Mycobacterium sp. CBMA293]|uniref:cytochrome P450 n=1 Tax=unclassified Mycolicibacterium TaxID=2636767 RepID=UPI0012DCF116|nr:MULTISPECIES: cytochrome P450 [unclassified Mycolicibacterium]MUL49669.1 cytochrome P450 [Mycolicibacterium sp. CBMA 360]MUL60104.1 cytochrome P450 [Mycolicibacterium sp. CBMA 335]MUL72891.1 cytochrome P450 [Mycolicibacterium sp. CBMA 311]MUL96134.1 cytochrome P450 [Mycolicibacterium sp. CBMA 230]MUM08149.1 cytochrome [Mycolicibacterium sp. CBMA 213]